MSGRREERFGPFGGIQDGVILGNHRNEGSVWMAISQPSILTLMCNQGFELSHPSQSEIYLDQNQAVYGMDPTTATTTTTNLDNTIDEIETPRVKFLCSFGGSILPRPLDGKLRYVGGETRIVSLPRDITFNELMLRMKELFEGTTAIKYQQPDEDLDALVSLVNNDDVTNMMEEYDKLGAGDGFTRLRIFLFSHSDHDIANFDTDLRETERRYVDALNNSNDPSWAENKIHTTTEQFLSQPVPGLPQFNLHHLNIPHPPAVQASHQQLHAQRYNHGEMEGPWSPSYYSPSRAHAHDLRPDFPSSPSSGGYRMPFAESNERMPEEYARQLVSHQYPHQSPAFVDNLVWVPPGPVANDKVGFPGNLGLSQNNNNNSVYEGGSICDHCQMSFQRYPDLQWIHDQPHHGHPNSGNEFAQYSNPCPRCLRSREAYVLNQEEPRSFYNESHNRESGWAVHHQFNHLPEEPRTHLSGVGRVNEHYTGSGLSVPYNSHSVSPNCVIREDPWYVHASTKLGNEGFHEQNMGNGPQVHMHEQPIGIGPNQHITGVDECGIRHGNVTPGYGVDSLYQASVGSHPVHALRRKVQNTVRGSPSCEVSGLITQANGAVHSGFPRSSHEGTPNFSRTGLDDMNSWSGHPQKVFSTDILPVLNPNILVQGTPDPVPSQLDMQEYAISSTSNLIDHKKVLLPAFGLHLSPVNGSEVTSPTRLVDENILHDTCEAKHTDVKVLDENTSSPKTNQSSPKTNQSSPMMNQSSPKMNQSSPKTNGLTLTEGGGDTGKLADQPDPSGPLKNEELCVQHLSFIPELIASVKKAALEGAEEVKARAQGNDGLPSPDIKCSQPVEPVNAPVDLEHVSDNDNSNSSKIEPTKAEEEALARGLQTIKNDDLEEIRELGSGTYGSVYHGKWKGSDVAIKRIKASCFSGRPSERERLIADFWKEALILGSLHHPNVVSFYGIVRDGPDGTLATVTEFMVNGSLKQFLQKKDRTIDRRKRLIIAMDAAFGMEYLHGKNIVHFDLKCENLLVNMRDPHRPICKIGDLGLSKVKQHTLVSGGVRGTLPWMAPELLSGKSNMVTEKIDVYSFGIVMWELLTGEEPYADMHCASIIGGIVNNTLRPQIPTWCDPEWKSLMESCWSSEPGERPSFSEISQKLRKMAAAINVK